MLDSQELIPVVDYCRASLDRAKDEHTVKNQHRINQATAKRLGCRIVKRFADNDKSAAKAEVYRDHFEEMLKVVRAGRLRDGTPVRGTIVVAEDRLVRRAGDYERFVDALTSEEGRVFADKRGFQDLYSENVENMGLMGAVASRIEVKKMRRRVREWHRSRALEGTLPNGYRPFGWQGDRTTRHPIEGALLQTAAEEVLSGRSISSIVKEWNRREILTARGNKWAPPTLKQLLRNPRICGLRAIRGEVVKDESGDFVFGNWEPIVTVEQWQALCALFDARAGKLVTPRGTRPMPIDHQEHRYLLTGILLCGRPTEDGSICGTKLRVTSHRDVKHHLYACKTKAQGGCSGITRRGDKVDEFVSEAVLSKLEERATAARKSGPWDRQDELAETEEQLRQLRANWRNKIISNDLFFAEAPGIEAQIKELRADRDRHALEVARQATDMADIRRRWYSPPEKGGYDISQKRALVRQVLHAVVIHPAGQGNGRLNHFNADLLEPIWRG